MSAFDYNQKDKTYVAGTYSRQDVMFVRGEGSRLYDEKGKSYIDFASGIAVTGLGHNNKKWVEAITKQASLIAHASNLFYSEPYIKLAETLCARTGAKKVFLCNSGAEANECAIKTARKYAYDKRGVENPRVITLVNSFHGRTMATLTATGQTAMHKPCFAPFADGFDYAAANDVSSLLSAIKPSTAAVMIETVQGESGVIPLETDYVKEIEKICRERDILLIVDEVQTGNGRTGALYSYMLFGITPDIVTTAKGLGNGLPIGAVMFGEKTADVLGPGDHGSTFGANPVVCAGALAVLEQLDDKLIKSVDVKRSRILSAIDGLGGVKSVSGLGLMIGIETDDAKGKMKKCLENGLVVLTAHDKLRLLPPLNISDEDVDAAAAVLKEVLK